MFLSSSIRGNVTHGFFLSVGCASCFGGVNLLINNDRHTFAARRSVSPLLQWVSNILERTNARTGKLAAFDQQPIDFDIHQVQCLRWYIFRQSCQCQDLGRLQQQALLEIVANRSTWHTERHAWQSGVNFLFGPDSCDITRHMPLQGFQGVSLIAFEHLAHSRVHEEQKFAVLPTETCHLLGLVANHDYVILRRTTVGYRDTCTKTIFPGFSQSQLRPSIPTSYGYDFRLIKIVLSHFIIPSVN